MNKRQYDRELEAIIVSNRNMGRVPTLLLHSCCGPCSTACIERLSRDFLVTVFYYNPNISPESEYRKRVEEQMRFIEAFPTRHPVHFIEGRYDPENFYDKTRALADAPEGGDRCRICFAIRLSEAARMAAEGGFDYVTTTLTVSPLKNADDLNRIGEACVEDQAPQKDADDRNREGEACVEGQAPQKNADDRNREGEACVEGQDLPAGECGTVEDRSAALVWLPSDFKKRDGYRRSIELSREYDLYRQNYCGCIYSKKVLK